MKLGLKLQLNNRHKSSGSSVFLLDEYPGAAAAYALIALSSDWVGQPVIRVRRSSDNAEQNFTETEINNGTLVAWIGGSNNGFITTWYDQTGNGNHAIQSVIGFQPKIVSSGVLITQDGLPAIEFEGANDLIQASRLLTANTWSIFSVINKTDISGNEMLTGQHTGLGTLGRVGFIQFANADLQVFFNNGTSYSNSYSTSMSTSQALISSLANSNNYYLALNNGSLELMVSGQSLTPLDTNFNIGALGNNNNAFKGHVKCMVVYASDQTSNFSSIKTIINNTYSIY